MIKISFLLLFTICFLVACQDQKRTIVPIEFSTEYKLSNEIESQVLTETLPFKYQISAADYAEKADYKNALIHWDSAMPTNNRTYTATEVDSIKQKYAIKNAKEYIVQEAKKNQVVIINEAHHNSMHRAFTKSLLQELYDNGYKHLGLEALSNGEYLDSALKSRGYPIMKTGSYTSDPQFGDMIREALQIGYEVFAYENLGGGSGKEREIGQAQNIQKVIEANPNEKFLIHCGFAHVLEGPYKSWEKAMAGRLKEYTGIDPFTINQEEYTERSKAQFNPPLLKMYDLKEASVLIDQEKNPFRYERNEAWADVAVLHPTTTYIDNRPDWLFKYGLKKVVISLADIPIEFPVMILAYKKGEAENAIPIDITEAQASTESSILALPKGAYNIVVTNKKESFTFEKSVE